MCRNKFLLKFVIAGMIFPFAVADELDSWLTRSNGVFSIHEAAATGDEYAVRVAAMDKATLNMPDELGRTPLDIAVMNGHEFAAAHLIACGAAASEQTLALASTQATRDVVMGSLKKRQLEIQLCEAVASNNMPEVRRLLAQGVNADALTHDYQMSVLMAAVQARRVQMVQLLLDNGADVNYVNVQSKSVLHIAAAYADGDIVHRLLAAGANPMMKANNDATPLHDAVWQHNLSTVKALLPSYTAVNYNPDGGRNGLPLMMAISNGSVDIVRAFIAAGTNLRGACFEKMPPLVWAVMRGRENIARELLKAGADPDACDMKGQSARDYAAMKMPNLFQ